MIQIAESGRREIMDNIATEILKVAKDLVGGFGDTYRDGLPIDKLKGGATQYENFMFWGDAHRKIWKLWGKPSVQKRDGSFIFEAPHYDSDVNMVFKFIPKSLDEKGKGVAEIKLLGDTSHKFSRQPSIEISGKGKRFLDSIWKTVVHQFEKIYSEELNK